MNRDLEKRMKKLEEAKKRSDEWRIESTGNPPMTAEEWEKAYCTE